MYKIYRILTRMFSPFLPIYLKRRLEKGKEDAERLNERFGKSSIERPKGKLIWLHGASVGEVLSLQSLIAKMTEIFPQASILLTSGTVSSAKMMAEKLPPKAFHQYIPIDTPDAVESFLDHWQPDMVLWAESDLWPNMLMEIQKRQISATLINGRMSKKSCKNWKRMFGFGAEILKTFQLCLVQNENEAEHFSSIGGHNVYAVGNLKYASKPLDCHEGDFRELVRVLDERPSCLYASTHQGEEALAIRIHKRLKHRFSNNLTIIAPRHPERRQEIIDLCEAEGLKYSCRSKGEFPSMEDDVLIADTFGELGLFYRAISLVVIGGSFVPHGGQNPIEAGRLECQILYGPHMHNFVTICEDFEDVSAARRIPDEDALFEEIHHLYFNPVEGQKLSDNARRLTENKSHIIDNILQELYPVFHRAGLHEFPDI